MISEDNIPTGSSGKIPSTTTLANKNKDIRSLLTLLEDGSVKEDFKERIAFFRDKLEEKTDSRAWDACGKEW
jgi:hypothetical protein